MGVRKVFRPAKLALALAEAAILENEDAVVSWIKGYLMDSLKPVTPGHLAAAIRQDKDFWGGMPEGKKKLVRQLAGRKVVKETFKKYSNMITLETFLTWMTEERPDLMGVLINWPDDRGMKWMERSLQQVKDSFVEAMG